MPRPSKARRQPGFNETDQIELASACPPLPVMRSNLLSLTDRFVLLLLLLLAAVQTAAQESAASLRPFELIYTIELLPRQDQARVTIALGKGAELVKALELRFDPARFTQMQASQGLAVKAGSATWKPAGANPALSYLVRISHRKNQDSYDARMTADWALFRGDKVIPSVQARLLKGARSRATLRFKLPPGWTNVDTGFLRRADGSFDIDNPERKFDRPIGWMIAGKVGTRRDQLGLTEISVAAPKGDPLDRMDALTFINFLWPSIESAFGKTPKKILIVGAGDPMWRGGLSAPNALFLHSERPLVSENATSTLSHELTHVVTRIRGQDRSDWIAEGIAEFYSIELLYRAGGMTDARYAQVHKELRAWGKPVTSLRGNRISGEQTARAVQLLKALDEELKNLSKGKKDLDDLVRVLRQQRRVSTPGLIAAAEKLAGGKLQSLNTPLLR